MSTPPTDPVHPAFLVEARSLGGILWRAARAERPQVRSEDLIQAADLMIELAAVVIVYRHQMVLLEDMVRQRAALRSLVERAKEDGIDEDWRKEARVVLRATEPAGRSPGEGR